MESSTYSKLYERYKPNMYNPAEELKQRMETERRKILAFCARVSGTKSQDTYFVTEPIARPTD
ncbi:Hypothetical protein PACV_6 [Pacmanvirus A23]|uniref:Hypothetical protein n=1 Tax=Pacmanvirus A23 TaxID=1932881 RepID=UPI000A09459E|nr:Hypothetical protein B9W72_gp006 [Pacmanvirus A23]SIP85723.1 Hypothetical protein PACV_6 [Pacmanvirus A23]